MAIPKLVRDPDGFVHTGRGFMAGAKYDAIQRAHAALLPERARLPLITDLSDGRGFTRMAKLNAAERNRLPGSTFGLPGQRKYPMPDKNHARVAESYASKEYHAGRLSLSDLGRIRAKAKRILAR